MYIKITTPQGVEYRTKRTDEALAEKSSNIMRDKLDGIYSMNLQLDNGNFLVVGKDFINSATFVFIDED